MEFRVLKYFLTVVREENITKAANVLHITQPTLSLQLAQLEEDIGVKLFNRGTRKISLTNEGMLLRRRAEEIISLVDKTEQELNEQDEMLDGVISLGCGELSSVSTLADILAGFKKKHPLIVYDLYTANADEIKEKIDKGLIDIGLLLEPVNIEKYEYIRLQTKEVWGAVMRADDELAKQEFVTAEQLSKRQIILARRPKAKNELAHWFGKYYDKLNISFTSNMSTNASIMVEKGLGNALIIKGSLPFLDENRIKCIPLYPALIANSVLVWKRHQPFNLATTKFIEYIQCFLSMK